MTTYTVYSTTNSPITIATGVCVEHAREIYESNSLAVVIHELTGNEFYDWDLAGSDDKFTVRQLAPIARGEHVSIDLASEIYNENYGNALIIDDDTDKPADMRALGLEL